MKIRNLFFSLLAAFAIIFSVASCAMIGDEIEESKPSFFTLAIRASGSRSARSSSTIYTPVDIVTNFTESQFRETVTRFVIKINNEPEIIAAIGSVVESREEYPIGSQVTVSYTAYGNINFKDSSSTVISSIRKEVVIASETQTVTVETGGTNVQFNVKQGLKDAAPYTVNTYDITYNDNKPNNSNGMPVQVSDMPSDQRNIEENTVTQISATTPNIQSSGNTTYTFNYWTDNDGNIYQPGQNVTMTKDLNLSAQWTPAGGGSSEGDSSSPSAPPSSGDSETPALPPPGDTDSPADRPRTFTVRYNTGTPELNIPEHQRDLGQSFTINSSGVSMTRAGYTFSNWTWQKPGASNPINLTGSTSTSEMNNYEGDIELVAKWTEMDTLYVSNTGDDNYSGTSAAPFATIGKAFEVIFGYTRQDITINITGNAMAGAVSANSTLNMPDKTIILQSTSNISIERASGFPGALFNVGTGTLQLQSITIATEGGNANAPFIQISGGTVDIRTGTTLQDNYNANQNTGGGAISMAGGTLTIGNEGISITNNSAYWGGGIYVTDGTVNINNETLIKDNTDLGGGTNSDNIYIGVGVNYNGQQVSQLIAK